jgi:hypothetical protein
MRDFAARRLDGHGSIGEWIGESIGDSPSRDQDRPLARAIEWPEAVVAGKLFDGKARRLGECHEVVAVGEAHPVLANPPARGGRRAGPAPRP